MGVPIFLGLLVSLSVIPNSKNEAVSDDIKRQRKSQISRLDFDSLSIQSCAKESKKPSNHRYLSSFPMTIDTRDHQQPVHESPGDDTKPDPYRLSVDQETNPMLQSVSMRR
jgi:hypothetical protein